MNCSYNKTVRLRISEDDERFFREAARHILNEDNLSEFLRRAGHALIEKHHGKIRPEREDIRYNPEDMPLKSPKTGAMILRFGSSPYKKRRKYYGNMR